MRLARYLLAAMLLAAPVRLPECAIAADSKRITPELLTCPAAATMSEDKLEMWKRIRSSLEIEPALDGSEVLVARMLVIPSMFPEWEVSIYLTESGEASVRASIAQRSVYDANHVQKNRTIVLRKQPALVNSDRYTAPLKRGLAEAIGSAWSRAIHRVQMPKPEPWASMDGTAYVFSRWVQGEGEICGETHEPVDGSIPARLRDVGKSLLDFARAEASRRDEKGISLQETLELLESGLSQAPTE